MPDRKLLLLLFISVCLVSGASAAQRGAKPSQPKADRPPAPDLAEQEKQKKTISEMRNVGVALFSWLTDQVAAGAAGAQQIDLQQYPAITHGDLEKILVPDYLQSLPKVDAWGHAYEYRLNVKNPLAKTVMSIRSPGRDGAFSGNVYKDLKYPPRDLDQDIVWIDGFFAGWDERGR